MENKDTGILLNKKNIELQRFYFKQAVRLIGIQVSYRAPRKDKKYNGYGELDTYFCEPIKTGIIFEEHPSVWTMRKLGWDTELQDGEALIHVPYDLPDLQRGALFEIPSGLDNTSPRTFKVLRLRTSMVYPSEIICHIAPIFTSTTTSISNTTTSADEHRDNNFRLLRQEEDDD